jgi:DNA replication protein DnaC
MNMSAEERKLRQIKAELIEKFKCFSDGDVRAAQEFEIYMEMWRANIPLKYWDREIPDVVDGVVNEKLQAYAKKLDQAVLNGIGLYLFGTQGTGKTLAACLVLKEAIRKGYRVYFTMLTEVLEKYCDGRYDKEARAAFTRSILEADFLVVDDIDKGYISDKSTFIDTAYDYVFRTRANKNLPVIITSNMKREEFGHQDKLTFGRSLISIFDEHLIDVLVQGKDRRKEIQERLRSFLNE